ncbi:hypothetical protein T484DRAFT_1780833 [Baffinella frigidus]|nr:hypothetical protein T484DRAFT_1780833 [Cryptophyta sp. CCMP2293]
MGSSPKRHRSDKWERIPFDQKDDLSYDLRWTEVRSDIDFARFRDKHQLANHIPNASAP